MAQILKVDDAALAKARWIVAQGGVIVVPTDTVYGVACDPRNPQAIERIYELKQRPHAKSMQLLLSSLDQLADLDLFLPPVLEELSRELLPGAFSPIALANEGCRLATLHIETDGRRTQAIRVPDSEVSLSIIEATGPLAATSANMSGQESARSVEQAYAALGDGVALYLDGGPTPGHVASTVVAAQPNDPDAIAILREGVISAESLRAGLRHLKDPHLLHGEAHLGRIGA